MTVLHDPAKAPELPDPPETLDYQDWVAWLAAMPVFDEAMATAERAGLTAAELLEWSVGFVVPPIKWSTLPTLPMCTCAMGCSKNRMADRGVWPECRCWCHEKAPF